nr:unnamed protein product [Callosobruchus chinensis]
MEQAYCGSGVLLSFGRSTIGSRCSRRDDSIQEISEFKPILQSLPGHITKTPKIRSRRDLRRKRGERYVRLSRPRLKSSQYFTVVPDSQKKDDALQRPIVHMSAFKQATGEAQYVDDLPQREGELYCSLVLSTKAHAKVLNIDETEALKMEGVHGFVSAKDIKKGRNQFGPVFHDEKVIYDDEVTAQGQILGVIVADNQLLAQKAAKKVKVTYQDLPVIVSVEDAIKHNSFLEKKYNRIVKGDVEAVFKSAPHVVEGECRMGGQEHFYLETCACLKLVSEVLDIPQNRVSTKVKRIGGGFGGKESRAAAVVLPIVIAAKKFNRPMRCMLDRDEDMLVSGGRNPFFYKYKVIDRAMTHVDNSYNIPAVEIKGHACKTNLTSNTAFRGFGGPQGMFLTETMCQHIADNLGIDPIQLKLFPFVDKVSEVNLYQNNDFTYYNQQLTNCTLDKCWKECVESSNYYERRKTVQQFNSQNRYKKRGLSIIPTKYGIAFTATFLNQGGALVLVYTDGSVLISHGGVEIGQGLHTKMIQVASRVLGISTDKIHISETATDKVPNASPTAASSASDLNGMAVMEACMAIKKRLEPYMAADPNLTWEDWVSKAYFDRVCLSAVGFHKTPGLDFDWETMQGSLYNYYTYGVACTEVEIDTLTGDHQVIRTDIVMDLGESLNPAIDIGQIEGAFMQGYGLFVLEEMMYSSRGDVFTRGPGTYKIPGFTDIPGEFNAVGEPPLFLASSALFAIKDAIKAAREENGIKERHFILDAPATSAKIRMACQDSITAKLKEPEPGSFKPWNVVA